MSAASDRCVLFVGPSGAGAGLKLDGVETRPPARRGDVAALVASAPAGVVAIADGMFHQDLAVGHAEMRAAVERGWQVWGLSSIGAIRACEMRHMGVRGYGDVYRRFVADPDFSDDEVALLHAAHPPYQAVSEPLVHIRVALDALVDAGVIGTARRRWLLNRLSRMWYGERTLGYVRSQLAAAEPGIAQAIADWVRRFDAYRVKSIDLRRFLDERPWQR